MGTAPTDAEALIAALALQPHPEGGFYTETWRDQGGSAIYFLLVAPEVSAWHRVWGRSEIWHHYGGSPAILRQSADGQSAAAAVLGDDLSAGQRPQLVVAGGTWQAAASCGPWSLVGCTVSPPFSFDAFELAPPGWSPEGPGPLVGASWLADRLADDGCHRGRPIVVADVRWYLDGRSGSDAFAAGHIPSAVWVDLDRCLADPPSPAGGRHPLPDPERFAAGMAEVGIDDDSVVVAYDDNGGLAAARLVWLLRTRGQPASLLDGGLDAWRATPPGVTPRALATGAGQPRPSTGFSVAAWPRARLADAEEVATGVGILLDARPGPRFRGDQEPIDPRPGHIPGARSRPAADNLDGTGHFRTEAQLRADFAALGVRSGADVVAYCGSGVTACHDLLALEAVGLGPGRLYPGSWSQWSADPRRPAELGDPRAHPTSPGAAPRVLGMSISTTHQDSTKPVNTLAIDVGGTGIKASVLDTSGHMEHARVRVETPYPLPPTRLIATIADLVRDLPPFDRISLGFPGVVRDGIVLTAPHFVSPSGPGGKVAHDLLTGWTGFNLASSLSTALAKPARVANDADLQGATVIKGVGVELVVTLGTGLGTALFSRGRLCPHLELAHHPFRKDETYNDQLGEAARERIGTKKWTNRVKLAIATLYDLTVFDHCFIGGGNASRIKAELGPKVTIVDNDAGILGGIRLWEQEAL